MAKLIGTAGHVDHGKTTLIQALTGIDADRLPEEKSRGMTIDIGFAYWQSPTHGRVSIVDVPGHERFVTNMLVGALGIDVALLCVSADEGLMPQSREHLQILDLLPVQVMVVAITRSDIADADTIALATLEIQELLAPTRFENAAIVPVSAVTGAGLDELRLTLDNALSKAPDQEDGPWYLPIDRSFNIKGRGCVVTGTLTQGAVRPGENATLMPGGLGGKVRSLQVHGEDVDIAEPGQRTAMNLAGVKLEDVRRGMAVGKPGTVFPSDVFDAAVRWIVPPKHGLRVRVAIGTEEVIGKVFLNDSDPDIVQLRLETMAAVALNQPIIVRRYSPPEVLGGGRVTVPQSKKRRKSEAPDRIMSTGSDRDRILALLAERMQGVPTEEVCRLLGRTSQALGDTFERLLDEGRILGFAGLWFSPECFESAKLRFLASLQTLHEAQPNVAALPRDKAATQAGLNWTGKPFDRIISHLSTTGEVAVQGTLIRKGDFRVRLSTKQEAFLQRVSNALNERGLSSPTEKELATLLSVPIQAVTEIVKLGVQAGELIRVGEDMVYTKSQLNGLAQALKDRYGDRPFTAAEFRDDMKTSRKYAIPLLEYLDATRVTLRTGDTRAMR